jgi:hypothetical protein
MRFYNQPYASYCGADLHSRTMYLHILDDRGRTRFDQNLRVRPDAFLDAIALSPTAQSSAANACSPGTGSETCARSSTRPWSWARPVHEAIHGGTFLNGDQRRATSAMAEGAGR